jgi:hypothetical protein
MNKDYDSGVYEKVLSRFKSVLGRFNDLKRRLDAFPRKPEILASIFNSVNREKIRRLRNVTKDLEKKADLCENLLKELEGPLERFLSSEQRT